MPSDLTAATPRAGWNFDNSFARLPDPLYVRLRPVPVRAPRLVVFNRPLAEALGLDAEALAGDAGAAIFAGNRLPQGAEPLAQAYAGHQFGHFTMLGDGRAILLGEQLTPAGERFDIQLKGSGPTPFSRGGDGRAALGPMLREYIVSEAMHALGIPSTRSLAVAVTGEPVDRETALAGAVLTRVAASHIRIGTFEYLASRGDQAGLRTLADYTLRRHYPSLSAAGNPYLALFSAVMERQATLLARWLHVGFVHGVMNTDNMAISGETIDYGPCAFMDAYDPATVFSSIDLEGRYAYENQPNIAQWNLARFAETLLPLIHADQKQATLLAEEAVRAFPDLFRRAWFSGMRAKLGLFTEEDADQSLIKDLLTAMQESHADYTATFSALAPETPGQPFALNGPGFPEWLGRWQARLARQPEPFAAAQALMRAHNPQVIPRNHLVEEALAAATERGDFAVLERLLAVLARPYEVSPEHSAYCLPPAPSSQPYRTFCGT